jgi:small subunit ribosomal protein S7
MPRKGPAGKRVLVADPVYNSPLVTSLINKILLDGKRSIAERIVYNALEGCRERTGNDPVVIDPVYSSPLVTALVNKILLDGKKSTAERIVYGALEGCREKSGTDPVVTLKRAMDNVKPTLEVRSRRVGGATYQVPVEVRTPRQTTLGLRWLVQYSKARREKTMIERLQNELLDASNGLGASVKRREDTHKMAESNKAFAHYRW